MNIIYQIPSFKPALIQQHLSTY